MTFSIDMVAGDAALEHFEAIASLQERVFRAFPHLCGWTVETFDRLLQLYAMSYDDLLVIVARDGDHYVGASTGRSLKNRMGRDSEVSDSFRQQGWIPEEIFYCSDSVVLPEYRGRGLGVEFFRLREDYARGAGYRWATFCGVLRPEDHPMRPVDYRPLDEFWINRGFTMVPGMLLDFSWPDIGEEKSTPKRMQFWAKELRESA